MAYKLCTAVNVLHLTRQEGSFKASLHYVNPAATLGEATKVSMFTRMRNCIGPFDHVCLSWKLLYLKRGSFLNKKPAPSVIYLSHLPNVRVNALMPIAYVKAEKSALSAQSDRSPTLFSRARLFRHLWNLESRAQDVTSSQRNQELSLQQQHYQCKAPALLHCSS